ncbi:ATP-binding cassette domain-containing protein, partial [Patescibacteria group bacterium]
MAWLHSAYGIIQGNVIVLVGAAVLLVGGLQTLRGTLTVGALLSFYVNLNLLTIHLRVVTSTIPTIIEGRESLRTLQPLLEEGRRPAIGSAFRRLRSRIDFEDVGFSHPESNFELQDVSFTVNRNETFGIFGPSGSGKTTLVRLLTGQYEPERGRISVDGRDVRSFDGTSYRQRIGVLSQDILVFPGTVRENLTYGLDDVDDARLRVACRLCRIDGFIERLADRYDTVVGDFGARLSGGQKQRLA